MINIIFIDPELTASLFASIRKKNYGATSETITIGISTDNFVLVNCVWYKQTFALALN